MTTTLEILRDQQLEYIRVRDSFKSEVLLSFKLIMAKFEDIFNESDYKVDVICSSEGKKNLVFDIKIESPNFSFNKRSNVLSYQDYKFLSNKEQKRLHSLITFLLNYFLYLPTEGKENIDIIEFYNSIKGE